jgi:choline-sulfatase
VNNRSVWAGVLGVSLALPALTAFGQVLHRTTHHRPLAAATYAVAGAALVLGLLVVTARLLAAAERGRRGASLARCAIALAGLLALVAEVALVRSALRHAGDSPRSGLVGRQPALAAAAPLGRPCALGGHCGHRSALG